MAALMLVASVVGGWALCAAQARYEGPGSSEGTGAAAVPPTRRPLLPPTPIVDLETTAELQSIIGGRGHGRIGFYCTRTSH